LKILEEGANKTMLVSETPVGQVYSCHLTKAVEGFLQERLRKRCSRNHRVAISASTLRSSSGSFKDRRWLKPVATPDRDQEPINWFDPATAAPHGGWIWSE
jgi:hypothetical protein